MMNFPIKECTNKNFPSFNKPEIVGYFSLNGQKREYSQDLSQLKYYDDSKDAEKRKVKFDLNKGIDIVIKPANSDERIDHLLRWIIDNHRLIRARPEQKRWLRPDFVTFRGLLTKICCTPFDKREGWIICAAKFHGTIYLCAFDNEQQKHRYANLTEKDRLCMSWGYKFEQYALSDSPSTPPDTTKPVNEAEEFCCFFSSKLGQNIIFYGAEMDGVCSEELLKEPVNLNAFKFVELKTNRIVKTDWQNQAYKRKLLKWWCQSFLVGIENIVCGSRTDRGLVLELENIKVSDMPKICKDFWNASDCMNFCDRFLQHVKTVVTRDYHECIYKFEYKLNNNVELQVLTSKSQFSFLPHWFIEQANNIIKTNRI